MGEQPANDNVEQNSFGQSANDNNSNLRQSEDSVRTEKPLNAESAEQKKVIDFKARIKEMSEDKRIRNVLYPIVEKIDDNSVVQKARDFWNSMPYAAQAPI